MGVVTLPAEGWPSVRLEIDLRDLLGPLGCGRMTVPAHGPGGGLGRPHRPRIGLVPLVRLMAGRAREPGVVRHCLLMRDPGVTGRALLRHHRGNRRVGIVAVPASLGIVVSGGVNLRKTGWTGSVVRVTGDTELPRVRHRRLDVHWPVHMSGGGTVAGLAGYTPVIAAEPLLCHHIVTVGARRMAGILDRPRGDGVDRGGAIVTYVAECLRNQAPPHDQEAAHDQRKHSQKAGNLLWHSRLRRGS